MAKQIHDTLEADGQESGWDAAKKMVASLP